MPIRPSRNRPGEVSLTECPFDECREEIPEAESFARHWEDCPANPVNGGPGAFPSDRRARADGGGPR